MADLTLVQELAQFAASTTYERLPQDVCDSVRQRVLDIIGIGIAAASIDTSRAVLDFVAQQGGARQAHAIGLPDPLPAAQAAFVNGVLAHSLDYDDTHLPSILHPSASVVPAALAAAELTGASGEQLLAAVAVGLELCVRLGMAGYDPERRNSLFFERGQHATAMCGAVAAAAAAAMLTGADPDGISHAMGITCSMASGLLEANRTGGTVKRLHCGWAAHAAITAVELMRRGITGPPTVLEGRFGFFQAFIDGRFWPDQLQIGLGETWVVPAIHFKPYPANHFAHTAIDAAMRLREAGLDLDDVERILLAVASPAVHVIGEPIDVKRAPDTGYQAQFSGPYAVVAALTGGHGLGLGLDDFTDELARDPRRRNLMARVEVVADERCDALYPEELACVLSVETSSGDVLVEEVLANRGGPARPLSDAELAAKFRDNATRELPDVVVDEIETAVWGIDDVDDIGTILAPTGRITRDA